MHFSALDSFVSQCIAQLWITVRCISVHRTVLYHSALHSARGPGCEALVHKSQTVVSPPDECRLTQIAVFVLTNTRWAHIPEAARNTNCRWKKSQLQMGEIRGEMQEIRRGRVRMQIARGFPPNHRTFSIILAVVDEDWRCSKPLILSYHIKIF